MKAIFRKFILSAFVAVLAFSAVSCADVPPNRLLDVPAPQRPVQDIKPFNEKRSSVLYVPLGEDILRPKREQQKRLPVDTVGPIELRAETLAAALQLLLGDRNIPLAFETDAAFSRKVTVSGLKGPLDKVIERVCGLADLYCSYEDEFLTVRDTETFTVTLPPIGEDNYQSFADGLSAVTGTTVSLDNTTRSLIYTATQRTNRRAEQYFEKLRANTALIVFETQIWEVLLSSGNDTGIDWDQFDLGTGNLTFNLTRDGTPSISSAVGIGAQYVSSDVNVSSVFSFLATQGAVKTVSQPQITTLSGGNAVIRVGNTRDYISEITRSAGFDSSDDISITTSTLETGLTLEIDSAWDRSTVYGDLTIELQELLNLDAVDVGGTSIQLPEVSERTLETRIRVRPGDAIIIGGIVTERDDFSKQGMGLFEPIIPTYRSSQSGNTELVIMMRPRVIVYTDEPETKTGVRVEGALGGKPRRFIQPVQAQAYPGEHETQQMNRTNQELADYLSTIDDRALMPEPGRRYIQPTQ